MVSDSIAKKALASVKAKRRRKLVTIGRRGGRLSAAPIQVYPNSAQVRAVLERLAKAEKTTLSKLVYGAAVEKAVRAGLLRPEELQKSA